jgi:hypothetical protein
LRGGLQEGFPATHGASRCLVEVRLHVFPGGSVRLRARLAPVHRPRSRWLVHPPVLLAAQVVQRDHRLDSYKLDAVAEHFLGDRKHDVSPADVFRLQRGSSADRRVIAEYCIQVGGVDRYKDESPCSRGWRPSSRVGRRGWRTRRTRSRPHPTTGSTANTSASSDAISTASAEKTRRTHAAGSCLSTYVVAAAAAFAATIR